MGTTTVSLTNTFSDLQSRETLAPHQFFCLSLLGRVPETPAWGSLAHPNIAAPLLSTDFVTVSTLDELMQASRIPLKNAVGYISQALCGLAHAHSLGVLHRDIKPSNIMVTAEGLVKLMGFGGAALANGEMFYKPGASDGQARYQSPEAILGHDLDQRSDIYSLGVVLYHLVTGQLPFAGSEEEIVAAHLNVSPRPPHAVNGSLPAAWNDVILTALAKDPAERFQTAAAFHAALSRVAFPLMTLPAWRVPKAVSPHSWRGPCIAYGTVNLMILLALLTAVGISKYRRAHPRYQPVVMSGAMRPTLKPSRARWRSAAVGRRVGTTLRVATLSQPTASTRVPQFDPPRSVPGEAFSTRAVAVPPASYLSLAQQRARMARVAAGASLVDTALQDWRRRPVTIPSAILASQERLHSDLRAAEVSFDRNDVASANLTLDAAERDLEQVDSFLHQ